jgi:hypothetical protein
MDIEATGWRLTKFMAGFSVCEQLIGFAGVAAGQQNYCVLKIA